MSISKLDEALELADSLGGDFDGEKDPSLISKAEEFLDIKFPASYREFLRRNGCGDIDGFELYGIISKEFENSSIPNAIWITKEERLNGLPKGYVIIGSSGDGGYYVLDTNYMNEESAECPVMHYHVNGVTEKISDCFGMFFLNELQTL